MNLSDMKVGQRVKIGEGYQPSDRDRQIGRKGVITSVGSSGFTIMFDDTGGYSSCFIPKEIDPIAPAPSLLPTDAAGRKKFPIATGVLDYFPSALLQVALVSYLGNQQHNPGQPLHWARGKSTDQEDTTIRHFMERVESDDSNKTFKLTKDSDGSYHLAKAIWRMLATFQLALEAEGAPLARGARLPEEKK